MTQTIQLLLGDSFKRLRLLKGVVAVVTDPPYFLGFMNKDWDKPQLPPEVDGADWKYPISEHGFSDGGKRLPAPSFSTSRNPTCRNCGARQRTWEGGPPACECGEADFDNETPDERRAYQVWSVGWLALVYEMLPPGGVVKVFSGTRTFHRVAAAMQEVGFEKPSIAAWIQGQGFPKSLDISKAVEKLEPDRAAEWVGWGTALKPSWEIFLVAKKP